jgi:cytochrome c
MRHMLLSALLLAGLMLTQGCGSEKTETPATNTATADPSGLSQDELTNGIGPVKAEVVLGDLDPALAETGRGIWEMKCLSCHKLGERFIGPDLAGVLDRRTPAYVLNMILNPEEMVQKHPEAKKLLAEYLAPMAQQNLTQDEARAVLEYIRTAEPPTESAKAGK